MSTYETARIDELTRADGWAPIRRHFGIGSFGLNAWTGAEAGATIIPEHDEVPSGHEEVYLVLSGGATFTVAGDEVHAPTGAIVFVRDPSVKRAATATEDGTTVLAVGGRPGEAYRPRSWETNVDAMPLWEAGKWDEVKALMLDAL